MRGVTHTLLGAAVVLPVALQQEPALAAACLWCGVVGGGLPDWIDFRSDLRAPLRPRHRGVSHSLFALLASAIALHIALVALRNADIRVGSLALAPGWGVIEAAVTSLALGFASHLAADATTHAGIRPLLPLSGQKVWLLPRPLRGRYDGVLDTIARVAAIVVLAFGLVIAASRWLTG